MKRGFFAGVAALALAAAFPACGRPVAETDFEVGLTQDLTGVVIKRYTGTASRITIPASIQDMPIREIGRGAFEAALAKDRITKIVIPPGVVKIGEAAFGSLPRLSTIVIPETVAIIERSAFSGCAGLTAVALPANLSELGDGVFSGCAALSAITIPGNITRIPANAFSQSGLTSIEINEGVTEIGDRAFENCRSLVSAALPSTLAAVGTSAFSGCSVLVEVTFPDPAQEVAIGRYAFQRCPKLALSVQAAVRRRGYTDPL